MNNRQYIYEEMPVNKAVLTMAIPTVVSQIISMIYNIADTFFIGQLDDPNQVAAVSIAAPVALLLTALANLFGIGGASMFSRALGEHNLEGAKRISSLCLHVSILISLIISALLYLFPRFILRLLGADTHTMPYAHEYIFWVITIGALPSLMSMVMSHFVRADGAPKLAGAALSTGGVINLVLDPFFIFDWGLGLGIKGAAIATLIANICTFLFFARYFFRHRKKILSVISPPYSILDLKLGKGVIGAGLPSMLQTLLASASNVVLNNLVEPYGATAVAAFGVVKKLDQFPMSVAIGFAQGIVPLVGFSHSTKNAPRLSNIIRFTLTLSVSFSIACVALYELFPEMLLGIFINHPATIAMGAPVLRIMCCSTPLMAAAFTLITYFQSTGQNRTGVILSVMRKGAIDIPLMYVLGLLFPVMALALVQPITESITLLTALILYHRHIQQDPT